MIFHHIGSGILCHPCNHHIHTSNTSGMKDCIGRFIINNCGTSYLLQVNNNQKSAFVEESQGKRDFCIQGHIVKAKKQIMTDNLCTTHLVHDTPLL